MIGSGGWLLGGGLGILLLEGLFYGDQVPGSEPVGDTCGESQPQVEGCVVLRLGSNR